MIKIFIWHNLQNDIIMGLLYLDKAQEDVQA